MLIVGACATSSFEIADKRFYLPGIKLVGTCPKCGVGYERDFGQHYLSYPHVGKPFDEICYCHVCEHEWTVTLVLDMTLQLAVDPL